MILTLPQYLRAASIQDASIRYKWDDWDDQPALETPNEELVARLKKVSQRAVLAYECGTAEWIVYRFGKLSDDPVPWTFLEGAWAMIVSIRYCGYGKGPGWQHYSHRGWDGPVRRPIKNALTLLEIDFQELAREFHTDPSVGAALLSALATYVMTDPAPYRTWSEQVLERFESLYSRDYEDPLGDVVPRQAIDPGFEFQVLQTEPLINHFLSSLDYRSNIFLSTPEGMLEHFETEEDFEGTPYRFNMEADRHARRHRKPGEHHH